MANNYNRLASKIAQNQGAKQNATIGPGYTVNGKQRAKLSPGYSSNSSPSGKMRASGPPALKTGPVRKPNFNFRGGPVKYTGG